MKLDRKGTHNIKKALRKRQKAQTQVDKAQLNLIKTIRLTKTQTGASLSEIGLILGVSRQRVHQLLKGE